MLNLAYQLKMSEDGRRVRQIIFEGKEVDVVHFAYYREDWSSIYLGLASPGHMPS